MEGISIPEERLSSSEVRELTRRSAQGDAFAREQLLSAHLYLVEQLVGMHIGRGVDQEDLFQEGCYGLLLAIDKYDESKGATLATYAVFWINKYIKKCLIQQGKTTSIIPDEHFYYRHQRLIRAQDDLLSELGRNPTEKELAERTGFSVSLVRDLRQHMYEFVSMDAPDDAPSQSGRNPYEPGAGRYNQPSEHTTAGADAQILDAMLDLSAYGVELTEREEEVLRRRLGYNLPDGEPQPYRVISADLGLSIEALRAVYLGALEKIRAAMATPREP